MFYYSVARIVYHSLCYVHNVQDGIKALVYCYSKHRVLRVVQLDIHV